MNTFFPEVKKNFGLGCMRFKKQGDEIDKEEVIKMVDYFMENGFNYFDTAHLYLDGKSEPLLKEVLTMRYPRESYVLTTKLSTNCFEKNEEIIPIFEKQLKTLGVSYFDFYLMHSQNKSLFEKYERLGAYETVLELKKQGRIKHFGISFHDDAETLEKILLKYPEIEVVQIQLNYVDYDDASVQSKKVYDVCRKYNKPVIVMEPVKGGNLANLPKEADEVFKNLGKSPASLALRFAADFEGVFMVLSGMNDLEMMKENVSFMKDFKPLDEAEKEAIDKVKNILKEQNLIPCTSCGYCLDVCPEKIPIPSVFACFNSNDAFKGWSGKFYYSIATRDKGKASSCIKCGKCENICPQHLKIREHLEDAVCVFENQKNI